jgi:hypothetical protein
MKKLAISMGAAAALLGGIGAAGAQPSPIQGTPTSLFPHALPHEIKIVDGVPCRTVYDASRNLRVIVECAGPVGRAARQVWSPRDFGRPVLR